MPITYEEWQAALEQAEQCDSRDAKTMKEWRQTLGYTELAANRWIRSGLANEWMRVARVKRPRLDGIMSLVPAYAMVDRTDG